MLLENILVNIDEASFFSEIVACTFFYSTLHECSITLGTNRLDGLLSVLSVNNQ